jgi:RNA methyltransferase, TrmH family
MRRVSSRQNPVVARFRELARGRDRGDRLLLEGEHLIAEAHASQVAIEIVAIAERRLTSPVGHLAQRLSAAGVDAIHVPDVVMSALSPTKEPSGIVAIARLRPSSVDDVLRTAPALVVVLAGIQDAGNVGAIIRAADGCGATGIIATDGTADPFGWKALRGAMGSTFRLPIALHQPLMPTIDRLKQRGVTIVATDPRRGTLLPEARLTGATAIVLGSEGAGLAHEVIDAADALVTIPMRAPVESFNVAITAALILYEAGKQRAVET